MNTQTWLILFTYPPFKVNGLQTTGPWSIQSWVLWSMEFRQFSKDSAIAHAYILSSDWCMDRGRWYLQQLNRTGTMRAYIPCYVLPVMRSNWKPTLVVWWAGLGTFARRLWLQGLRLYSRRKPCRMRRPGKECKWRRLITEAWTLFGSTEQMFYEILFQYHFHLSISFQYFSFTK